MKKRQRSFELSIEEKAMKLRVKYILTHSFIIKDNGFDLWCKLENTENGVALFSNKISEPMSMTTQMVGKLANDIVTSLKVKTKQDVMKAPTINVKSYEYYLRGKYKYEKRKDLEDTEIAQRLLQKAIELDNHHIRAKVFLANLFRGKGEREKSLEICLKALKQAEELGDKDGMGYALFSIAFHYIDRDIDTTLNYFIRSFEIFKLNDNRLEMSRAFGFIGNAYADKGYLDKAFEYGTMSFELSEELGDKVGMGLALLRLGYFHFKRGDYDRALHYYNEEFKIWEELDEKNRFQNTLTNIGLLYYHQHNYLKALEYLDRSAKMQLELDNKMTMETASYLFLTKKKLGKQYDEKEINIIINKQKEIHYQNLYALYYLLEDTSYLETAYNQVQEKADNLEPDVAAKFLSYPIPKVIVEEWEKVKKE